MTNLTRPIDPLYTPYVPRYATSADWALENPILRQGEEGWDIDKRQSKRGDGRTRWNDLPFPSSGSGTPAFEGKVVTYTPLGDGTDETTPLQSAANSAAALIPAAGTGMGNYNDGRPRPRLVIPPGYRIKFTSLTIHEGVDLWMEGSALAFVSSRNYNGERLRLGRRGYNMVGCDHRGLLVVPDSADYGDPMGVVTATGSSQSTVASYGIAAINFQSGKIHVAGSQGSTFAVADIAAYGGRANAGIGAYKQWYVGPAQGKFAFAVILEDVSDGTESWNNQAQVWLQNAGGWGSLQGNIAGVLLWCRHSNFNSPPVQGWTFYSPCFQMGAAASYNAWSAGENLATADAYICRRSGGWAYKLVQNGTCGSTAPHLIPNGKTVGSVITDGGAKWYVEGPAGSFDMLCWNAGHNIRVVGATYLETGQYGVQFIGPHLGSRICWESAESLPDDAEFFRDHGAPLVPWNTNLGRIGNNVVEFTGEFYGITGASIRHFEISDLHLRAAEGANGVYVRGMVFNGVIGWVASIAETASEGLRITSRGIVGAGDTGLHGAAVLVDAREFKRHQFLFDSADEDFPPVVFIPLDAAGNMVDSTYPGTPAIQTSDASWQSAAINYPQTGLREAWVTCSESVAYIMVRMGAYTGRPLRGIRVRSFPGRQRHYKNSGFVEKFPRQGRACPGTPVRMLGLAKGEIIQNISSVGAYASVIGWQVTSGGSLAPAWTSGQTVYKGQPMSDGTNIYVANADGTTAGANLAGDTGVAWTLYDTLATIAPLYGAASPTDIALTGLAVAVYDNSGVALTADSNLDGIPNGATATNWGTVSNITLIDTVRSFGWLHREQFASAQAGGYYQNFPVTTVAGHSYWLFMRLTGASMSNCHHLSLEPQQSIGTGSLVNLHGGSSFDTYGFYVPPEFIHYDYNHAGGWIAPGGTTTNPADCSDTYEWCARIDNATAGLQNVRTQIGPASLSGIYPAYGEACIAEFYAVDLTAIEAANSAINFSGKTARQVYDTLLPLLRKVPPALLQLTDTATGQTRTFTAYYGGWKMDGSVLDAGFGSYTDEQAQDAVGATLTDTATINFTYNAAAASITADVKDASLGTVKLGGDITTAGKALLGDADAAAQRSTLGLGTAATLNVPATGDATSDQVVKGSDTRLTDARAPTAHNQTASTITDFAEAVDGRVAALLVQGSNITLTYNDTANTLTVAATGGSSDLLGAYAFAALPAASSNSGKYAWVTDVGYYNGSLWRSNGTIWRPTDARILLHRISAPDSLPAGAEGIREQVQIPAGVLITGSWISTDLVAQKSGTSELMSARLRLGTAGTTADQAIASLPALLTSTNRVTSARMDARIASDTTAKVWVIGSQTPYGVTTALPTTPTISSVSGNALYLSFTTAFSASTETGTLENLSIYLER